LRKARSAARGAAFARAVALVASTLVAAVVAEHAPLDLDVLLVAVVALLVVREAAVVAAPLDLDPRRRRSRA